VQRAEWLLMDWFESLFGFAEHTANRDVAAQFELDGQTLTSRVNRRVMHCGTFETPTLQELRVRIAGMRPNDTRLQYDTVLGDAKSLHADPANSGALFQVASQSNTLEMIGPEITPEAGITRYEFDHTQGPACAIACAAGTVYRNYFVPLHGGTGQTAKRQVNCLSDFLEEVRVEVAIRNGYCLPTEEQLERINKAIAEAELADRRNELMGRIRIGLQWDTEVTLTGGGHLVSQAYCSAMPIAYSKLSALRWEPLGRLTLDAAYEATLLAGVLNARSNSNNVVFLTSLGGGAFGNPDVWIDDSKRRALALCDEYGLDVRLVKYAP
jgi:hypothetical protein